jgi:hypothetical protein
VKISLGTFMSIIGKVFVTIIMLGLYACMDFLIFILTLNFLNANLSIGATIIILTFYLVVVFGVLFFHWFALLMFIDTFNLEEKILKLITNLIYKTEPCKVCISFPICKKERNCEDLDNFIFQKRVLSKKIKSRMFI